MLGGLIAGQLALAPQLLDQRVVVGDLLELAVAEDVGAAVADVAEADLLAVDAARRSASSPCPNATCPPWARSKISRLASWAVRAQQFLRGAVHLVADPLERLDRHPRGDLAGLRPAHAVGDREQRRAREVGVLVGLAAGDRCR